MRGPDDTVQTARRFYKAVSVDPVTGGFAVNLDGRPPKSPGGLPMVLPTEALAGVVAGEWARQGEFILLGAMPATRLAFTAIEKTANVRDGLADEFVRYAGSDGLCYFADSPEALAAEQAAFWGPLLDWAANDLALKFEPTAGIIHKTQSPQSLEQARALALALDDFSLIALVHATGLFGSAILALAVQRGRLSGQEAHDLARLDEAFQEARWGHDEEAAHRTALRREEALMLGAWFDALR